MVNKFYVPNACLRQVICLLSASAYSYDENINTHLTVLLQGLSDIGESTALIGILHRQADLKKNKGLIEWVRSG